MCRLLYVRSETDFDMAAQLRPFAELSRSSREYQGHGWGCSWRRGGEWSHYHDIRPVWEDDLGRFGRTKTLVAHARSAFEDRNISVENNMPFFDGRYVFVFNGELRGVRIRERGRIGAEKILNFVRRFDRGDRLAALNKALPIIRARTSYVKAMNLILADENAAYLSTEFNENAEYFTMHERRGAGPLAVCSEPFPSESGWRAIPTGTVRTYR